MRLWIPETLCGVYIREQIGLCKEHLCYGQCIIGSVCATAAQTIIQNSYSTIE